MLVLDHLAISAATLDEGAAWLEQRLGLPLSPGGRHPLMATHNRLMGLGDLYLEVIAPDPDQPPPGRPRWFDLDNFSGQPRLTNWVAGSNDLIADLSRCPAGTGIPLALARGDYRWMMAVPADGKLPYDSAFPALIEWQGPAHPARALPDHGLRLRRLTILHPQADRLRQDLVHLFKDPRICVEYNEIKELHADFYSPHGPRSL